MEIKSIVQFPTPPSHPTLGELGRPLGWGLLGTHLLHN